MGYFYLPPPPFIGGAQPYAPAEHVPPSVASNVVNNPPFIQQGRREEQLSNIRWNWEPPFPGFYSGPAGGNAPWRPRQLQPRLLNNVVDQPPPFSIVSTMLTVQRWEPRVLGPYLGPAVGQQEWAPKNLPPALLNNKVNQPPIRREQSLSTILKSWEPPFAPWEPQVNFVVQGGVVVAAQVPYSLGWLPGVINAWQLEQVGTQKQRLLPPGIPGVSVDNPPPLGKEILTITLQQWISGDFPRQEGPYLVQVVVGGVVQERFLMLMGMGV